MRLRLGQRADAADVVRPYLARAPADIYAQILLDPELAPLADVPGLLAAPALPGTAVIGPDGPSISGAPFAATDDLIAFVARLGAGGQPEVQTVTLVVVDRRTGAARAELRLWHRGVAPDPNLAIANRFLRDLGFVTPAGLELAGAPYDKRRLRLSFASGAALEYRAARPDRGTLRLVGADGKERGRRPVDLWRDARVDWAALWPDAGLALLAFHHDGSDQGEGYDSLHGSDGEASLAVVPLGNHAK